MPWIQAIGASRQRTSRVPLSKMWKKALKSQARLVKCKAKRSIFENLDKWQVPEEPLR